MRVLVLSSHYRDPANRSKLRALVGLGVELTAGIPGGTAGIDAGVRLVPIPTRGEADARDRLRWHGPTLKRVITEIRPDLVQVEEEPSSRLAALAASCCRKAGVRLVAFSWQSAPIPLGFFPARRFRHTLEVAAGVIGGNERAAALLHERVPDRPVAAIPQTGVTPPAPLGRPDRSELVVGFVGRLTAERRAGLLIQSLGQTFGHWQLVIVGTGPEQEAIEDAVERFGLASRVRWSGGIRKEVLDATWPEIDCLVMPHEDTPAWVEPHSPVLLEAMAHGVAPIVTRAGALPEIVGEAGVVVADGDALTAALQRWVTDPAKCRAMGARARQRILERYVDSAIAERTLEFWRRVAGQHPASRAA